MTEIRRADRRDIPALIELLAAQLSEHGLAAGREQVRRGIEVAFEARAPLLVAREGLRTVGACLANRIASAEHGGSVLFIEELYVAPDARRRGVARAPARPTTRGRPWLRRARRRVAGRRGPRPARALYRSLGFASNTRTPWVLELSR